MSNQIATVNSNSPAIPANVAAFVADSRAENTKRAYRSDWAAFSGYCSGLGLVALPAAPDTVARYIADMAGVAKVSTISRRVASISTAHKIAGLPSPCKSELVLSTLKGIKRSLTVAQVKKQPVRVRNLRAGFETLGNSPADIRNRALILIGYAGGFRRSELVALNMADIERAPEGLIITVRRSKTDQQGQGLRKGIPYGSNPATCPVRAFGAWADLVGETDGAIFRRIRKGGVLTSERLTDKTVADVIKAMAPAMGLVAADVSGHSMRSGFVTDAYASGAPEAAIMATTGHRSHAVMQGYRREANIFKQNAAAMVGL